VTILAYGAEWPTLTPSESDALDLATLLAMVLTALAHPWELLDDVAPWLAERLARVCVWVDSRLVHAAWLQSFRVGGAA
jgi:hypothetical protein